MGKENIKEWEEKDEAGNNVEKGKRKLVVVTLGPDGSFSKMAARMWVEEIQGEDFKKVSEGIVNYEKLDEIMEALNKGEADIAIVPIENSTHGTVVNIQKNLFEENYLIRAEIILPITHNLLSKSKKENIKTIVSHPQAIGQCKLFLKTNFPNVEIKEVNSTSEAAQMAAQSIDGSIAAIASSEAAEIFKLKKLEGEIQDNKNNCTRFLIITRNYSDLSAEKLEIKTGKEIGFRTSIIVKDSKDKPGSLYEILEVFAKNGINLTRIESKKTGEQHEKTESDIVGKEAEIRTSIIVKDSKDKPGSLYEILEVFAKRGINLIGIKSNATGEQLGSYEFLIDFERKIENEEMRGIISDINKLNAEVSIKDINFIGIKSNATGEQLGSYKFLIDLTGHIKDKKIRDAIFTTKPGVEVSVIGSYPIILSNQNKKSN